MNIPMCPEMFRGVMNCHDVVMNCDGGVSKHCIIFHDVSCSLMKCHERIINSLSQDPHSIRDMSWQFMALHHRSCFTVCHVASHEVVPK